MKLELITQFLEELAPLKLAESWDNVGLLWGDAGRDVTTVMTCLTLTPEVAQEAVERDVDLIVTHHPILFRPIQKLTTQTDEGAMLLLLASRQIAVYSAHTAFDSAESGINSQWCELLELQQVSPLRPCDDSAEIGSGRAGLLSSPVSLGELIDRLKEISGQTALQHVGSRDERISKVAVACGSAAEFMHEAKQQGCDVLVTGEARFHACLEAKQLGLCLILLGHYASERFACEKLAEVLTLQLPELTSFASQTESDPLQLS